MAAVPAPFGLAWRTGDYARSAEIEHASARDKAPPMTPQPPSAYVQPSDPLLPQNPNCPLADDRDACIAPDNC